MKVGYFGLEDNVVLPIDIRNGVLTLIKITSLRFFNLIQDSHTTETGRDILFDISIQV